MIRPGYKDLIWGEPTPHLIKIYNDLRQTITIPTNVDANTLYKQKLKEK